MTILWVGAEIQDFTDSYGLVSHATGSAIRRTDYARCVVAVDHTLPADPLGDKIWQTLSSPITSGWIHTQKAQGAYYNDSVEMIWGFHKAGIPRLMVACAGTTPVTFRFVAWDGVSRNTLGSAFSLPLTGLHPWDMQVIDYGANGTVNFYCDGTLAATYTGDLTVGGVSDLDGMICFRDGNFYGGANYCSEMIVADEDTRYFNVKTHIPGSDVSNNWDVGGYANIDELNPDASEASDGTAGHELVCDLSSLPDTDPLTIDAVKIVALARDSGTPDKIELGVRTGGAQHYGAAQDLTGGLATVEETFLVNPDTGEGWTKDEINTLALALRTAE